MAINGPNLSAKCLTASSIVFRRNSPINPLPPKPDFIIGEGTKEKNWEAVVPVTNSVATNHGRQPGLQASRAFWIPSGGGLIAGRGTPKGFENTHGCIDGLHLHVRDPAQCRWLGNIVKRRGVHSNELHLFSALWQRAQFLPDIQAISQTGQWKAVYNRPGLTVLAAKVAILTFNDCSTTNGLSDKSHSTRSLRRGPWGVPMTRAG
jgi:hypothetical protein